MTKSILLFGTLLIACSGETGAVVIAPPPPPVDAGAGGQAGAPAAIDAGAGGAVAPADASPQLDGSDGNVCAPDLVELPTLPELDASGACDTPMRCGDTCGKCKGVTDGSQGCCAPGEVLYQQETCSSLGTCTFDAVRWICCPRGVLNFWWCKALSR
jgi:hypothetical protein